ncbi:MAG: rod shape-determining protein [Clostridia bacterium]|nr:rod shape-determining protein [Clostridia bacterium]
MAIDIGIDLGTSTTIIYEKTQGIVLSEPSLVIKSNTGSQVVAIGDAASDMMGRTPEGVSEVFPIRHGVITGFNATVAMLKSFVKKVTKGSFNRVRAVICIPGGITEVERRAVYEAARMAGIRDVVLMDAPVAAALGCGVDIGEAHGSMVVDIGAGICEAAVVSLGGVVVSHTIRTGGSNFDADIVQHIRRQYNMIIGDSTAESIKISIGSVYSGMETEILEVNGRDMVTGLPKSAKVTSDEIRMCLSETADAIVDAVKVTLENTPPELAADVMEGGIVLVGGGAMLKGLGRLININTEIPVYIAENPIDCVATGAGKAVEFMMDERGRGILGRQ